MNKKYNLNRIAKIHEELRQHGNYRRYGFFQVAKLLAEAFDSGGKLSLIEAARFVPLSRRSALIYVWIYHLFGHDIHRFAPYGVSRLGHLAKPSVPQETLNEFITFGTVDEINVGTLTSKELVELLVEIKQRYYCDPLQCIFDDIAWREIYDW